MIQNIIVCRTARNDNMTKAMVDLRAKMPPCPICGKRAFLDHYVFDGANYGYASGCPAFKLNDKHGISRPDDPKKPRFDYCDTKEEAYEKWVEYCKKYKEGTNEY